MRQKFLTNIAFLVFVNLLVKPFYILGIDREVQNTVGPEDFGLYFAVFNFSFLFHMILDFGINNFNNRLIARNHQKISEYFPNIILAKALLALLYGLLIFIFAWIINFEAFQFQLLVFLGINQVLISFILYFRSNISGLHHFRMDAFLSILDRLLLIFICSLLLWTDLIVPDFRIEYFVYAQTFAYFLTFLMALTLLFSRQVIFKFHINLRYLKLVLKHSYPFALLGLFMTVYNRLDGVMIERLLGNEGAREAGIYASAYRLLDAVNMFGFLFAAILLPMFSRMIKRKEKVEELLTMSARMMFVFTAGLSITCSFYRRDIMYSLYTGADEYWARIFGLLILGFINIGMVYIWGTLLTAKGKLKALNIIALTGVVLNILLNYFLILEYKAYGATIATIITQSIVLIAHFFFIRKYFEIKSDWTSLAKIAGILGFIIIMNLISRQLAFPWLIECIGIAFILLSITILSGYIYPGILREIRKQD